ncbi:MAG: hypothetical protein JNM95_01585 [Chitinophagaceae bacterium]|nr:hypothetical protein [Chitinophagaceae bacterium]
MLNYICSSVRTSDEEDKRTRRVIPTEQGDKKIEIQTVYTLGVTPTALLFVSISSSTCN